MRAPPPSQLNSRGVCRADPSPCCYFQARGWAGIGSSASVVLPPAVRSPQLRNGMGDNRAGRSTTGSKEELDPKRVGQGSLGFRWERKAKTDKSLCGACSSRRGSHSTVRNRSSTCCLFWRRDMSFLWDLPGGFTTFLLLPVARSVLSSSCPTCSLARPVSQLGTPLCPRGTSLRHSTSSPCVPEQQAVGKVPRLECGRWHPREHGHVPAGQARPPPPESQPGLGAPGSAPWLSRIFHSQFLHEQSLAMDAANRLPVPPWAPKL